MASSGDDEDLKLAMALSMQQSPAEVRPVHEVIDLTSDDEGAEIDDDDDEDLKRAIALSMQDVPQPTTSRNLTSAPSTQHQSNTYNKLPTAMAIQQAVNATSAIDQNQTGNTFAFDRKAMEAERLARVEARKRKRSPSPNLRPSKQQSRITAPASIERAKSFQIMSESDLQYPRGVIKRTFATKFPRTDDITIDELLQAPAVKVAVISSFQWDAEWVSRKLSHNKVKQHWVMNARDAETQARWRQDLADCGIPNLRIHFPPMNSAVGNAHSKYMLLVSEKKLRIVVSTANMEREYWGEVGNDWQPGVLENSIFIIDLPRRADGTMSSREELTPFGKGLMHFLEAQQLDSTIVRGVLKFDFSQTTHLAFVHSIGSPSGSDSNPTGLPGLAKAVQDLGLDKVGHIELDYATSSLGAINETFLQRIYSAAQGLPYTTTATTADLEKSFRIYYPTEETIKSSIGGPDCAGIITLSKRNYRSPTFPAKYLHDHLSTRKGMISHNKLLFARGRHTDGTPFAWVYVGSANMSESAWGAQKVLKSGELGKMVVRNWECGVVFPVPRSKLQGLALGEGEAPPMSVFEGTIEVPFRCPGQPHGERMPWFEKL